jgi:hypothetical protein
VSQNEDLLALATNLAEYAEIDYYDSKSGTVRLRFASTAKPEDIQKMCDDFKIEVELDSNTRLTYKISSIML